MCQEDIYGVVVGFLYGLFLGPLSAGFVYLFIATIILEAYAIISTAKIPNGYRLEARIAITAAAIMGWIVGRWFVLGETGVENLVGLPSQVFT